MFGVGVPLDTHSLLGGVSGLASFGTSAPVAVPVFVPVKV